jgi:hypothetical protein
VRGEIESSATSDEPPPKRRRVAGQSYESDSQERLGRTKSLTCSQDVARTAVNAVSTSQHATYLDSPAASRTNESISASGVEGVVLIEPVENPRRSKYAGKTSTQVLAKSAEDFSKQSGIHLGVMEFFCPLLNHAEEVSIPKRSNQPPLVDKSTALRCVDGQCPPHLAGCSINSPQQHFSTPFRVSFHS